MKGRKNKSALISSSSRSVWPMHIQELLSLILSLAISLRSPSPSLFFLVDSTSHPPGFSWSVPLARTTTDSILTYVRHPLISRLPSLIAPAR